MDKVSIIVPVYNVEDCLSYCVDSLRQQTYKNIEIILVDDGSTDSSGEICDQYAREDDRIKVLHIENGGLSNARNTGVKESSTDWIVFIDSDDYYDHRAIEYLVKLRDKYRVDLVATPVIEVRNYENSDFLGDFREKYSGKLDRRTALKQMFYGRTSPPIPRSRRPPTPSKPAVLARSSRPSASGRPCLRPSPRARLRPSSSSRPPGATPNR